MIKHLEQSKTPSTRDQTTIKNGKKLVKALFYIAISLTLYAFFLYLGEKRMEYKNKFSFIPFLMGKPECRNATGSHKNASHMTYLKNAFKFRI